MKKTLKIEIPEGFKIDNFDINSGVVKFTPIPKSITERIKTIEDVVEIAQTTAKKILQEIKEAENNILTTF